MTDATYVLCKWKERLWPAKVLTGTEMLPKRKKELFLNVQILSVGEEMRVKRTEAEVLRKSHIEDIATLLASQSEVSAEPVEELTYRRSLRVALEVLNQRTCSTQESSSREEGTAVTAGEKHMELASSLCDPSPSFLLHEGVLKRSGPARRERVYQRLSRSSTGESDLKCQADHKKRTGESESPFALVISAGGGSQDRSRSRIHLENGTTLSKKGRNLAQEPSGCRNGPSLPVGDGERESEEEEGDPAAQSIPSAVRKHGLCAKGRHLGLPSGSPTMHSACLDSRDPPTKQLCSGSTQRSGPRGCMILRSASRPTPIAPSEDTSRHVLEEDRQSSEESMEFDPINSILEEEEEDEELPRILLYHEPRSFEVGMLVWLKYQKYPFWPAVVKSIRRRDKKASVLFIEGHMDPKGRGITVPLRRLKHFDCKEKQALLNKAKEDFDQAIGWCISLITDYRVRLGCGSFSGSFLEYYAADISYPVRKSIQQDVLGTRFPQLCQEDPEMPVAGSPWGRRQPSRKVLPDRSRAARDRANQKLVEYIVKARGAESHLQAILKNRKPSRWLNTFLNSGQYMTCVETYLEDEEQLDLVVKYLQGVYQETSSRMLTQISGDRIRFILDVLLPEAIICAISAVDAVDYKTAEEKYIKGPLLSYREKEMFDNQLLEERNQRC
ncbi:PWWP domain-containing DNA repair factor 3A [Pteronotus mesoamericanus]|uniref:PWWP domain-containing DNA repair factor 3A n=1 Tax=Pteronotus mesoamericanus TaxID=1884717 RepID=UPI0023EAEBFC|nr:PWWP domain-containing DNA repair factor 3A [Pteronotus parnellii mesoamericanus]XP_054441280.1 PWWP domain-containing DNA repair factor 3A [Pteronotus parnellii mesoamericanus]XP_054441281.1 PWWP domain-containing DNA repair factor 3A [Pteronotus parnellii mesoamericanus]